MLCFWFDLVSVREHDLSDFCRAVFVGIEEGAAVPLGPCVMAGLGSPGCHPATPCPAEGVC